MIFKKKYTKKDHVASLLTTVLQLPITLRINYKGLTWSIRPYMCVILVPGQLLKLHLLIVYPSPSSCQQHCLSVKQCYCFSNTVSTLLPQGLCTAGNLLPSVTPTSCTSLLRCCPAVISSLTIHLKKHTLVFFFHCFTCLFSNHLSDTT